MEIRKPLKTTILFIGIFLVGIIVVVLFINKALDIDQSVDATESGHKVLRQVSQSKV